MAATSTNKIDKKEDLSSAPSVTPRPSQEAPKDLSSSRESIAGALADGQEGGEVIESGEVRETAAEGREVKGDGQPTGKKKDDGKAGKAGGASTATFTFDDKNLPAAPVMIKKIEERLRSEIRLLSKDAKKYQGGFFHPANPMKLSETMIEIRKKSVLLRRLMTMASEALKKLFLQMFGVRA